MLSRAFSHLPSDRIHLEDAFVGPRACNAARGKCIKCDLTRLGRRLYVGHAGLLYDDVFIASVEDATVRKPDSVSKASPQGEYVHNADCLLSHYPEILQYLATDKWDDGTARETSQLAIGFYDGGLRLSLNDRELKQSVYTQGDSLQECLDMLAGALRSDGVRWYKWNRGKKVK